ncbi:MAG TPA: hypothetical protein VHG91_17095 [Longimicrobium sp.]|nr:hypothetical protein [Longimicrobium sp.]
MKRRARTPAARAALLLLAASCASPRPPPAPAEEPSRDTWPDRHLASFIFERLDPASFRNSTGPRREPGDRTLRDHGVAPPDFVAEDRVVSGYKCSQAVESEGCWLYGIHVLGRRDFNGDGEDEVAICFVDDAHNGGSYRTIQPLLLKLAGGRVFAIHFDVEGKPGIGGCLRYPG